MSGLINYDQPVPFADNAPSFDVFNMTTNGQSLAQIWTADHIPFNSNFSGRHSKLSFPDKITPPALLASGGAPSVAYPGAGSALTTTSQYFYRNQQGTFPLNAIRAFGSFITLSVNPGNPITPIFSYNVNSITQSSPGNGYTIELTSDSVSPTGVNYNVVAIVTASPNTPNDNPIQTYSFSYPNLIVRVDTGSSGIAARVDFVILQI